MQEVKKILNNLRDLSGNDQIGYLVENKNNITLRQVIEYCYDKHKKYKIDESKYNKLDQPTQKGFGFNFNMKRPLEEHDWIQYRKLLDSLVDQRSAKDSDVKSIVAFVKQFNDDDQVILKMILFKDLRLNMNMKKFQIAWPDMCVENQVQLADTYDENNPKYSYNLSFYSRKFDGKRLYYEKGVPYSRANIKCKLAPIEHITKHFTGSDNYVYDGELLYLEGLREDYNMVISLSSKDERDPKCDNIYYVIFDMIDYNVFRTKGLGIAFEDEYELMKSELCAEECGNPSYFKTKYDHVLLAKQLQDRDYLYKYCKDQCWEGLMKRNGEYCYEFKKSPNICKLKEMKDGEFEIVSLERGTGKNYDRLGNLNIKFKNNIVGVGSGFNDEQRVKYWKDKDKIESDEFKLKYVAKVKYFEETVDSKTGLPSLRFPVFLSFREKKNSEEIV